MIVYTLSENDGENITVYEDLETLISDVSEDVRANDLSGFVSATRNLSNSDARPGATVMVWSTLWGQTVFIQKHEIKVDV